MAIKSKQPAIFEYTSQCRQRYSQQFVIDVLCPLSTKRCLCLYKQLTFYAFPWSLLIISDMLGILEMIEFLYFTILTCFSHKWVVPFSYVTKNQPDVNGMKTEWLNLNDGKCYR